MPSTEQALENIQKQVEAEMKELDPDAQIDVLNSLSEWAGDQAAELEDERDDNTLDDEDEEDEDEDDAEDDED